MQWVQDCLFQLISFALVHYPLRKWSPSLSLLSGSLMYTTFWAALYSSMPVETDSKWKTMSCRAIVNLCLRLWDQVQKADEQRATARKHNATTRVCIICRRQLKPFVFYVFTVVPPKADASILKTFQRLSVRFKFSPRINRMNRGDI